MRLSWIFFSTLALAMRGAAGATPPGMAGQIVQSVANGRNQCVVWPRGCGKDDVPNLLKAFNMCNHGGTVVFPENATFWIATRINPILSDVRIEWLGEWLIAPNISYWANNSFPITFQNHVAGIVFTGDHIYIDGHGTGHVNGSGDTWYTADAGNTQPGRPMPFVWWNVTEVEVRNFAVWQPALWSINIMNGTNMIFDNILCNATAHQAPANKIWTANTDGFDTMDVNNIQLSNFVYRGGDDCVAIKPRSYNVRVQNVTCIGGNGVAIGSLGQYLEDSSVENVHFDNVTVIRDLENLRDSAYIKTWMGGLVPQSSYESAGLPRGGGWGVVRNIAFTNFNLHGPNHGPSITQDSGDNGSYVGTSKMAISNIVYANWTGFLAGETRMATFSCSEVHPCYNIDVSDVDILSWSQGVPVDNGTCTYTEPGGVHGVVGC